MIGPKGSRPPKSEVEQFYDSRYRDVSASVKATSLDESAISRPGTVRFFETLWGKNKRPDPGCSISTLEVGCGLAPFSRYILNLYPKAKVFATDISSVALEKAKSLCGCLECYQTDIAQGLAYEDCSFDIVFMTAFIEHVFSPLNALREAFRVLRPGGSCFITTPNTQNLSSRLSYLVRGHVPRTEGQNKPPWEWEHIRFFTKDDVEQMLGIAGFRESTILLGYEVPVSKLREVLSIVFPSWFCHLIIALARR